MSTEPAVVAPGTPGNRLLGWTLSAVALRRLAIASLVANVLIVVTGGAVRLTNSGLGCPTWPSCTSASLTPTKAYSFHGVIEFTNRQLTFVVGLLAALTLLAAWRQRRQVRLAALGFLGIPAQAVLGGITVLTDLNPYAVACHFLLSMAVIAAYAVLVWRLSGRVSGAVPAQAVWLVRAATARSRGWCSSSARSSPAAGRMPATSRRAGCTASTSRRPACSQLHADAVMVLIGVTLGMVAMTYVLAPAPRCGAPPVTAGVELGQGIIGYTQYFLHVPPLLVALHMFGACLVWLAALQRGAHWSNRAAAASEHLADGVDRQAGQRADDRAVDPDELQVATDLQLEAPTRLGGVPPLHGRRDDAGQIVAVVATMCPVSRCSASSILRRDRRVVAQRLPRADA